MDTAHDGNNLGLEDTKKAVEVFNKAGKTFKGKWIKNWHIIAMDLSLGPYWCWYVV